MAPAAVPDWEKVRWHFEQALELQRELGYDGFVPYRLMNIAWAHTGPGKHDRARRGHEESQALLRALGYDFGVLRSLEIHGHLAMDFGNLSESERVFREMFKRAGDLRSTALQADSLLGLGIIAILRGVYDRAHLLLMRSRLLTRRYGAMGAHIFAVSLLGETAWYRGDQDSADSRWSEALDLARQHGSPTSVAMAKHWLSHATCAAGDFDRAEALCLESLEGFADGDVFGRSVAILAQARVALFRGDPKRSVKLFQAGLHDLRRVNNWIDTVRALEGLCWALAAVERYDEAVQLLGFLAAERGRSGFVLPPVDHPHHDHALGIAREGLGEEAFSSAWAAGEALSLDEAVAAALA